MKKQICLLALLLIAGTTLSLAQSRVFKAVSAEMSSQVKEIKQDDVLMGYVVFSKLERINNDSFSYKLTIIDENLNDIGTYSFKDEDISLQQVAFEQDVLCLAYLKNTYRKPANQVKRRKVLRSKSNVYFVNEDQADRDDYYKFVPENIKSFIYSQFLSLDGKLIATASTSVKLNHNKYAAHFANSFNGGLKNALQVNSIAGKGFAYVYGDGDKEFVGQKKGSDEQLLVYNLSGKEMMKQKLPAAVSYEVGLTNHGTYLHVLRKTEITDATASFELLSYNLEDSTYFHRRQLMDKNKNQFNVLGFKKHIGSGVPYLSGVIVKKGHELGSSRNKAQKKGQFVGIFQVNLEDSTYKEKYTYWSGNSKKDSFSKKGYIRPISAYPYISYTYDDYEGNTYFSGSGIKRKQRWGALATGIITAPLIVPPLWIAMLGGYAKYNSDYLLTLKQSPEGALSYYDIQKSNKTGVIFKRPGWFVSEKALFAVHNEDNHSTYLVLKDVKSIVIYNVKTKTTLRTIPRSDDGNTVEVYPAKAGHILLSEYNSSDGSTKLAIEAL